MNIRILKNFLMQQKIIKLRLDGAIKRQNEFLNKLCNIKIGKKQQNDEKLSIILINVIFLENKLLFLFNNYAKMILNAGYKAKHDETKGTRFKILIPKQMLQRLPIALAQVKAGNNSESLLNEIRKNVYILYQSKQITKKVYSNIIKSI